MEREAREREEKERKAKEDAEREKELKEKQRLQQAESTKAIPPRYRNFSYIVMSIQILIDFL
jgi:hypothetical protein